MGGWEAPGCAHGEGPSLASQLLGLRWCSVRQPRAEGRRSQMDARLRTEAPGETGPRRCRRPESCPWGQSEARDHPELLRLQLQECEGSFSCTKGDPRLQVRPRAVWDESGNATRGSDTRPALAISSGFPSWSWACTRAPLASRPHWPPLSGWQPLPSQTPLLPAPLRLKLRPADHGASGCCPSLPPCPLARGGAHRVCWCPACHPDAVRTCGDLPQLHRHWPSSCTRALPWGLLQSQWAACFSVLPGLPAHRHPWGLTPLPTALPAAW